jgi:hypothetical protein
VRIDHIAEPSVALRELDLRAERIALDVEPTFDLHVLIAQLLSSRHVEQHVRVAVERLELRVRHAEALATRIRAAEGPRIREAVRAQQRLDARDVRARIRRHLTLFRVVDPARGVFDVEHAKAERAQPE